MKKAEGKSTPKNLWRESPSYRAASDFARRDWAVFALHDDSSEPERATTDLGQLEQMWADRPDAGIGLATGPISGLWVLSLDVQGQKALARLESLHDKLPRTVTAQSVDGQRDLYFRWPEKKTDAVPTREPSLDFPFRVAGEKGFVVAPPSRNAKGSAWTWERSPNHLEPALAPSWLLDMVIRGKPLETADRSSLGLIAESDTGERPTIESFGSGSEVVCPPPAVDSSRVAVIPQVTSGSDPSKAVFPTPTDGQQSESDQVRPELSHADLVPIESIRIGRRYRKKMADLGALVESIARLGQLQPIVVTPNLDLIAGARRLAALTQLGRRKVLIHMVDELEDAGRALMAERDENSCRAPLRPSEAVALAKALEKLERTQARERQAQAGPRTGRGKKASGSGKLPEPVKGETREKVAKLVGMKPTTLGKAKKVVEAAECEPEKYQSVCDEMDETGNVDRAHKAVTNKSKLGTTKEKAPVTLPRQPEDIVEILWQERSREICVQVHRLLGARLQCQSNATEPTSTPAPMAGLPGSAG